MRVSREAAYLEKLEIEKQLLLSTSTSPFAHRHFRQRTL